jgi:formylglycine-generating enzyme required for sulfatase activity
MVMLKSIGSVTLIFSVFLAGCVDQILNSPNPNPQLGDASIRSIDEAVIVYVPSGEFIMGSDIEMVNEARKMCKKMFGGAMAIGTCQQSEFIKEFPAHKVHLDEFWIDQTEVTNAQYRKCIDAGMCDPPQENGSYYRQSYFGDDDYDNYPVIWVRWDQAMNYCQWVGGRLPTEAEWEYAARGPNNWIFPWGNEFDGSKLNYCDVTCGTGVSDASINDGYADTAPVGSYPEGKSWCGALDMAGNVREWVADWFAYYTDEQQTNPTGPPSGKSRIPRGGSWLDRPDDVRSTNRGENSPEYTRHKVGFRCVVEP